MKNQFGRSMVEMLGVLGVIGLLSIAGVEGYQYAVLRHRSNVVLKMAHQIAADIVNLPRMYQQTAAGADLSFTNKSGMTLPFAEGNMTGNMTATKIDDTVFRVNTPPLEQEQCEAVLKYARNYPLILERTFEEENCIGEEVNKVGLLYFSLDYGANDLNSTPGTPPAGIPSCGLCETFNKDTNQCECTPGTCETSDGQKGECSNCACIPSLDIDNPGPGGTGPGGGPDDGDETCDICEVLNPATNECERVECPDGDERWTEVATIGTDGKPLCCAFMGTPALYNIEQCLCVHKQLYSCATGEKSFSVCCNPEDYECQNNIGCAPPSWWRKKDAGCPKEGQPLIELDVELGTKL